MAESIHETTTLWEDYQNGLAYQGSCGLSKNLPTFVKFFEGKQWAPPTKNTKNLPRPVINIIKMICRSKKSAILSTPVRIVYQAEDPTANVQKFNDFADYIQKEYGQDALDKKAIDDAVKKGSYFYHYYWDSEARGKDGVQDGALRCEVIDPLNIFFSNPTETDEQKQKWILLASREDVESVRAKCDPDVDADLIASDESDDKYGTIEQEGNKLVTVLTRYFRKNGEVYFEKATKGVVINAPRPLAPDIEAARKMLEGGEDAPNNSLPDNHDRESLIPHGARAPLYPIVVGNYEPRENSIYGLGEVEGIIPNQKAINHNLGMALLNAQEIAWGKYIVHPNALKGQSITNEPGQTLIDWSGTGNGIKKMSEQAMQSQPLQLIETLTQLTRAMTGANEVMSGEVLGANMSGAAIAQLQAQAQQPIEELQATFWLVKEKQGKVLAQFFKLFYEQTSYSYMGKQIRQDEQGKPIMGGNGLPMSDEVKIRGVFNSKEFQNVDFDVVVETMSGTKSSAAGDINALDLLLSRNLITLKTYINAYPADALSNKTEILKGIEEDEQSQLTQLTQQKQQLEAQLTESLKKIEEMSKTNERVMSLIQENQKLREGYLTLFMEAKEKITSANRQIKLGNQKIAETTSDARQLAMGLASQMSGQASVTQGNGQVSPVVI